MLVAPDRLPSSALTEALTVGWRLRPSSLQYLPVGFGSHHWELTDTRARRWFVTVDDLDQPDRAGRLRAALTAAIELREAGAAFVVAPVPTRGDEPFVITPERFAVALYPFMVGSGFEWGPYTDAAHRDAVLDMVIALHTSGPTPHRHTIGVDDFAVPGRAAIEDARRPVPMDRPEPGPYARAVAELLVTHRQAVRRVLARYDVLVRTAERRPDRRVLTHGETHPGNTMLTADGWVLVDWDTALLAPPERDLWTLVAETGSDDPLTAYGRATGVSPLPDLLDLYRIRWTLTDIAAFVGRFQRRHGGSAEDEACWDLLRSLLDGLAGLVSG